MVSASSKGIKAAPGEAPPSKVCASRISSSKRACMAAGSVSGGVGTASGVGAGSAGATGVGATATATACSAGAGAKPGPK